MNFSRPLTVQFHLLSKYINQYKYCDTASVPKAIRVVCTKSRWRVTLKKLIHLRVTYFDDVVLVVAMTLKMRYH